MRHRYEDRETSNETNKIVHQVVDGWNSPIDPMAFSHELSDGKKRLGRDTPLINATANCQTKLLVICSSPWLAAEESKRELLPTSPIAHTTAPEPPPRPQPPINDAGTSVCTAWAPGPGWLVRLPSACGCGRWRPEMHEAAGGRGWTNFNQRQL